MSSDNNADKNTSAQNEYPVKIDEQGCDSLKPGITPPTFKRKKEGFRGHFVKSFMLREYMAF
jgi:hypothetical protein